MPVCHFGYLKINRLRNRYLAMFMPEKSQRKVREKSKGDTEKYSDSDCFSRNSLK